MTRHSGGEKVGAGAYMSLRNGGLYVREGEVLPGSPKTVYRRVPFPVLFILGTAFGGFYVLLFPVLMIGTAAYTVGLRILAGVSGQFRTSTSFGWRPTEAYLNGKDRNGKASNEEKE